MNKGTIVAAISLSALSLSLSVNESYAQEIGIITASALNVRTGAGTNYSKITLAYKDDKVEILSSANGWYNIRLSNGKTGWASGDYIVKGDSSSSNTQVSQGKAKVTASSLNVRKGPSTSYSRIGSLSNGQIVEILEKSETWSKIKASSGLTGWVSNSYLTSNINNVNENTEIPTNNEGQVSQGKAMVTASSLNVRKGPSTSYSRIGSLSSGQIVEILEKSGTWSKIKASNGLTGWVANSYLTSNINNLNENTQSPSRGVGREAVVELAYKQLGKKYVWGAEGPNTFDCSGLTWYVYKNATGKTLPRTSIAQSQYGQYVSRSELQPGDLIFSDTDNNGSVNHVGIYIGNGKMIHAPRTGDVVKISDINSGYYKNAYVTSRRP